jgi:hypothetical protein
MSYHKFLNLREILQGDLGGKVMKDVSSLDFMPRDCNCNVRTLVNGQCAYNGKCRHSVVVYKASCKCCKKYYIGNTQQKLKDHMSGHYNDVRALVNANKTSDTFATHFADHFDVNTKKLTAAEV